MFRSAIVEHHIILDITAHEEASIFEEMQHEHRQIYYYCTLTSLHAICSPCSRNQAAYLVLILAMNR
jgi:hypothetical protein